MAKHKRLQVLSYAKVTFMKHLHKCSRAVNLSALNHKCQMLQSCGCMQNNAKNVCTVYLQFFFLLHMQSHSV